MTSSLVGSEMCIRDSPEGALALTPYLPPRLGSYLPHWPHSWSRCSLPSACLLYTSDAADDM
eukprot:575348-Prorocentrum_lima.AAC.1